MKFLCRLWKEEEGQDLVEYALLALAVTFTIRALASGISDAFARF
jgi:Flp pilus assembly pilin Flp